MKIRDELPLTVEIISPNREKTPEGYLLCKGVTISRVGEFTYNADEVPNVKSVNGQVLMSRSADELFNADTIRSFEGKPIVIGHDEFADPSNWADIAVGIATNVRRGEGEQAGDLIADLLLTQSKGIALVESGLLTEVSCGYDAQAIDDGDGKGHQVGIVGNHIALVQRARCGSSCQIKDGLIMNPELIEKLRALFEQGDKEGFEAALAELQAADEEPEQAAEGDEEPEAPEADEAPEQADEVPPVEPEKSVEERLAVLEHEYQEMGAKLAKLLEAEKAEGHEELQDEAPEEVEDEESEMASGAEVRETLDEAEELCPGIKTPSGDCANGKGYTVGALARIKRNAIKRCSVNCFGDASALSGEALNVAFKACVKLARSQRNPSIKTADSKPTAQGFNARNAAYWKRN